MGQAGREFAIGRFDAPVMVEALERVYHEALAGQKLAPSAEVSVAHR